MLLGQSLQSFVSGFGVEKPIEGTTNDWLTPSGLVSKLGHFDLDPSGCPCMLWSTAPMTYFPPEHNFRQQGELFPPSRKVHHEQAGKAPTNSVSRKGQ